MFPTLQDGDSLYLSSAKPPFESGDIFLFYEKGEWITHRAIQRNGVFKLKGDANFFEDALECQREVLEKNVIAKVVGYSRRGSECLWGAQGQPFKGIYAFFSSPFFSSPRGSSQDLTLGRRILRKGILLFFKGLNQVERLWLKFKI